MLARSGTQMPSNVASVIRSVEHRTTCIDDVCTPLSINHLIQKAVYNSPLIGLISTILRMTRNPVDFMHRLLRLAVSNATRSAASSHSHVSSKKRSSHIRATQSSFTASSPSVFRSYIFCRCAAVMRIIETATLTMRMGVVSVVRSVNCIGACCKNRRHSYIP